MERNYLKFRRYTQGFSCEFVFGCGGPETVPDGGASSSVQKFPVVRDFADTGWRRTISEQD